MNFNQCNRRCAVPAQVETQTNFSYLPEMLNKNKTMWWGYLHQSGSILVKRWLGDMRDFTEDCHNNPFVKKVVPPFPAKTQGEAQEIVDEIIENAILEKKDGGYSYVVVHEHESGVSSYHFRSIFKNIPQMYFVEEIAEILDIHYEPEKGEALTVSSLEEDMMDFDIKAARKHSNEKLNINRGCNEVP